MNEKPEDPAEKNVVVRICFIGFFKKRGASHAVVTFRHENQVLLEPHVECGPTSPGWYKGIGSQIARNVFGDGLPFAGDASLEQAIQSGIRYIEAHKQPGAEQIDEFCKRVGGHVHVATVTPDRGFAWHTKPLA